MFRARFARPLGSDRGVWGFAVRTPSSRVATASLSRSARRSGVGRPIFAACRARPQCVFARAPMMVGPNLTDARDGGRRP